MGPKTIGLLGGMSWQSSIEYERLINETVNRSLGGTHSADLLIRSYNFGEIERLQAAGEWDRLGDLLAADAAGLERAGAGLIVLCTNTMHMVAPAIESAISIPFLHLADATADAIIADGISSVALLGTRYTMEKDFYRDRLAARGLSVLVPDEPDRSRIHDVIYTELVVGKIVDASKDEYLGIIDRLRDRGVEGVIAGCTEIELLVSPDDLALPYYPTTRLHAEAAAAWALDGLEG